MSDIVTIMWKEWKDSLFQGGWKAWVRPTLLIGIVGVLEPLLGKIAWMDLSPIELVLLLWFTFLIIISIVADSFAGERERHTLETLLASRMPDRAILLGKVASMVFYGWGVLVISMLLGAVVDNVAHGQGSFVFYPTDLLFFTLLLGLLVSTLGTGMGVLLSMRISTVRQVQQMLVIGAFILGAGVLGIVQLLPEQFFITFSPDEILWMAVGIVALLDAVLLAYSIVRFQRAKLILS